MKDSKRVNALFVGSDRYFLKLVKRYLKQSQYDIKLKSVSKPKKALEKIEEGSIDCIIAEYDPEGIKSIEFLKEVKANYSDVPYIIVAGEGTEKVASDAISAGVDGYIQKSSVVSEHEVLGKKIINSVERVEARQSYREIFEKVAVGIVIHSLEGEIIDANRRWCELLKYSKKDIRNLKLEDISAGGDSYTGEKARKMVRKAAKNSSQRFKWLGETGNGEQKLYNISLKTAKINGQERVLASVTPAKKTKNTKI